MKLIYIILSIILIWYQETNGEVIGMETLIIVQDKLSEDRYSEFFSDLKDNGLHLTIKSHTEKIKLKEFDNYLYENIILMAPGASTFGGGINIYDILKFIDSGRNMMVIVDSNISKKMSDLAYEYGIFFESPNSMLYDHFNSAITKKLFKAPKKEDSESSTDEVIF